MVRVGLVWNVVEGYALIHLTATSVTSWWRMMNEGIIVVLILKMIATKYKNMSIHMGQSEVMGKTLGR